MKNVTQEQQLSQSKAIYACYGVPGEENESSSSDDGVCKSRLEGLKRDSPYTLAGLHNSSSTLVLSNRSVDLGFVT